MFYFIEEKVNESKIVVSMVQNTVLWIKIRTQILS